MFDVHVTMSVPIIHTCIHTAHVCSALFWFGGNTRTKKNHAGAFHGRRIIFSETARCSVVGWLPFTRRRGGREALRGLVEREEARQRWRLINTGRELNGKARRHGGVVSRSAAGG